MDHIKQRQEEIRKNLLGSYSRDTILATSAADFIEKGKKANLGETRDWGGKKFQKTVNGWVPFGENGGKTEKHGEKEEVGSDSKKMKDVTSAKVGDIIVLKSGERAKVTSKISDTKFVVKTKSGEERNINLNSIDSIV